MRRILGPPLFLIVGLLCFSLLAATAFERHDGGSLATDTSCWVAPNPSTPPSVDHGVYLPCDGYVLAPLARVTSEDRQSMLSLAVLEPAAQRDTYRRQGTRSPRPDH
jgi:hypothetical protein